MRRNLVRSKNDGGHCIHERVSKMEFLPIFVKALGLDFHSWFRFNLLQIDVIRPLQTTLFMNTPGPLCRDLVFMFGANICFHSSFVFSFSRFSGVHDF